MPERYEIRGQDLPDGNKSLSPKDIYNVNKNFETVGLEVFGNADFTRKIDKKVNDLTIQTEAIISTVADKADTSLLENYSTTTQTADAITSAVSGKANATDVYTKGEIDIQSDNILIAVTSSGGENHIRNGNLAGGINGFEPYYFPISGTTLGVRNDSWSNYEPCLDLFVPTTDGSGMALTYIKGLTIGKTYTVGCLVAGHRAINHIKVVNSADDTIIASSENVNQGPGGTNLSDWKLLKITFVATDSQMRLRIYCYAVAANAYFWGKEFRCNEGTELLPFSTSSLDVISSINLSPEEIKIQSSKISIEGLTTINENFKVLLDGSIEAVNAKLSGSIIATRMSSSSSPYYYAEVGIMSNGLPGLALYNTQNNDTRPYVQIAKNLDSIGFGLCDANNTYRFLANAITTSIADSNGNVAFTAGTNSRGIYDSNNKTAFVTNTSQRDIFSPSGRTYIDVTDTGVRIVVNGVTKASW